MDGIHADAYVHAVREDPKREGLLYAGTEHGLYVSFNNGDAWRPLTLNLPDVQVPDLQVAERDLVIATHGRSMWILPDIEPLRQYAGAGEGARPPVQASRRHPERLPAGLPVPARPGRRLAADGDSRCHGKVIGAFSNSAAQQAAREAEKKAQATRDSLIKLGQAQADTCVARSYVPPAQRSRRGSTASSGMAGTPAPRCSSA